MFIKSLNLLTNHFARIVCSALIDYLAYGRKCLQLGSVVMFVDKKKL